MLLTSRANGNRFLFARDEERYGDEFLHCTLPKDTFAAMNVYQPSKAPSASMELSLSARDQGAVQQAMDLHFKMNHPSDEYLISTIESAPQKFSVTPADIRLMRRVKGQCTGCLQGKMASHAQLPTSKDTSYAVGEAAVGDVMFVDLPDGTKKPLLLVCDLQSRCLIGVELGSRSLEDLKSGYISVKDTYKQYGYDLKVFKFDRESSVVSLTQYIQSTGCTPILSAAGQKQGLIEVMIKTVKDRARATISSVRDDYGYILPRKFYLKLIHDVIQTINIIVKPGESKSPREFFTRYDLDPMRDLRASFGEIVVCHRPKRSSSRNLDPKAEWSIIVGRSINKSGVLQVYIIDTQRYAFRFKFIRARVPDTVLAQIKAMDPTEPILPEDDAVLIADLVADTTEPLSNAADIFSADNSSTLSLPMSPLPHSEGVDEGAPAEESDSGADIHSEGDLDANESDDRLHEGSVQAAHHGYNLRSRKPPGLHLQNDYYVNSTKQLTFSKAMKVRPEAAKESMIKELNRFSTRMYSKEFLRLTYQRRNIL